MKKHKSNYMPWFFYMFNVNLYKKGFQIPCIDSNVTEFKSITCHL